MEKIIEGELAVNDQMLFEKLDTNSKGFLSVFDVHRLAVEYVYTLYVDVIHSTCCVEICKYMQCMYVCMYVRMYVCMYVRMYVCMFVCVYVRMCVCTHANMYVYTYVCMYVCMYVHMYVCTYVCMYVYNACMCVLRLTHTNIFMNYSHARTYVYVRVCACVRVIHRITRTYI